MNIISNNLRQWLHLVRTITELFKIGGDMVNPAVATNLMSLIAEGTGNEDDDEELGGF